MKVLLCSLPVGSLSSTLTPLFPKKVSKNFIGIPPPLENQPPLPGILRINTWMEKNGYDADIYDILNLRPTDEELIEKFKRTKPTVVGLSATLSHCYPHVKRITKILRKLFPDIWIVVGGHLTGSSNVVLRKTETDICVVGDGEIPFVKLLDYFKLHPTRRQLDYTGLCQIKGLAFINENNQLKVTGNAEQLSVSKIEYPDYNKLRVEIEKFSGNGELFHDYFEPIKYDSTLVKLLQRLLIYEKYKNKKIGTVFSSRGCVARCTFCQRSTKGYRVYPKNVLETHIIDLKEKFNIGAIYLNDENFGSDRKHAYEVARIMKKHDIFWSAGGVRCTSVTYEDLKFYKENNLYAMTFGIESGSQKILDIMEKKFTPKDVYKAISNCKKLGIDTNPNAVVIGMPGETKETVIESAKFIASLKYILDYNWNIREAYHWAWAIPGTPLYEYCQQIGVVGKSLDEEEDYIIRVAEHQLDFLNYVNKTDSSIKEVHYWQHLYSYVAKKTYVDLIIKNNKSIKNRLLQIYERCIRHTFADLITRCRKNQKTNSNKPLQKMKSYIRISIDFLLALSILFLPKVVLFPIIRVYANLRFHTLKKSSKVKKGKQKHNLFISKSPDFTNNFRLTEDKVAKANRQIDLSLRKVVMENRKQMIPAITDEEKGLQILGLGQ